MTTAIRFKKIIMMSLLLLFAGCGSDNGNSINMGDNGNSVNMGGAVQGRTLSLANQVSTLAGSASGDGVGTTAAFISPQGITTDGSNLYVVDGMQDTVRKIEISTGAVTTLAGAAGQLGREDGTGSQARFAAPQGITTDGTNLYVTDTWNNKIRKVVIATGEVTTLAGSGMSGVDDGVGAAASFSYPMGITTDGTNLYVVDFDLRNVRIRKVVIATGEVTTLAGGSSPDGLVHDGIGPAATFYNPSSIVTDGVNVFVADLGGIRKVNIATGAVTTMGVVGSSLSTDGTFLYVAQVFSVVKVDKATGAVVGTMAGITELYGKQAVTYSGGNIFFSDSYNRTIRKLDLTTGGVTTVAGSNQMDGIGSAARFSSLTAITTDGVNLYAADSYDRTIRRIEIASGAVSTLAGSIHIFGGDGVGDAAGFSNPRAITCDGKNLYVAEPTAIRKVVIATGAVTTLAGSENDTSNSSVDGVGSSAKFQSANGITTDGSSLFVTDNCTIRKVDIATGTVTTVAGTAGVPGTTDGTGAKATFSYPGGITTDGTNLYVADGSIIRKVVASTGLVTTLAGAPGRAGWDDGIGSAATFCYIHEITTDGKFLYVTEYEDIRRVEIATGAVTTIVGSKYTGVADGDGATARFASLEGITTDGRGLYVTDGTRIRRIL